MIDEPYVTLWCSLYCEGQEAVGEMEIQFTTEQTISLPLCAYCADILEKNPQLALALAPGDVV